MKLFTSNGIKLNFWISEAIILTASNTYRGVQAWNFFNILLLIVIFIVLFQYCFIHCSKLMENNIKKRSIVFIELSFIMANAFVVISNIFWIKNVYEVNFLFIFILVIMLCPMFIVNSRVLTDV